MTSAMARPLRIEPLLQCVHADGVDLERVEEQDRRYALVPGKGPWVIGRAQQLDFFERLVPDESKRVCISRGHFQLVWEAPNLLLTKTSGNPLLLCGKPVGQGEKISILSGSEVAFCHPEIEAPFLALQVIFRGQSRAQAPSPYGGQGPPPPGMPPASSDQLMPRPKSQAQTLPQPQSQFQPGSGAPFVLSCLHSQVVDVPALPPQQKRLSVSSENPVFIGRAHPQGFFENLLANDTKLLSFISRNHFSLEPDRAGGGVLVTNFSMNPIFVNNQPLGKDDKTKVQLPAAVDFAAAQTSKENPIYFFLRFRLEVDGMPVSPCSATASAGAQVPPSCGAPVPPFILELGGSAVREGLPQELSRLIGAPHGLVVGRQHQPQLFGEGLKEGVVNFVSREHFRIDPVQAGGFNFIALSGNPIWVFQNPNPELVQVAKGQMVPFRDGNEIVLWTGAKDADPGQGSLKFRFRLPQAQQSTPSTPVSPAPQQVAPPTAMGPMPQQAAPSPAGSPMPQQIAPPTAVGPMPQQAAPSPAGSPIPQQMAPPTAIGSMPQQVPPSTAAGLMQSQAPAMEWNSYAAPSSNGSLVPQQMAPSPAGSPMFQQVSPGSSRKVQFQPPSALSTAESCGSEESLTPLPDVTPGSENPFCFPQPVSPDPGNAPSFGNPTSSSSASYVSPHQSQLQQGQQVQHPPQPYQPHHPQLPQHQHPQHPQYPQPQLPQQPHSQAPYPQPPQLQQPQQPQQCQHPQHSQHPQLPQQYPQYPHPQLPPNAQLPQHLQHVARSLTPPPPVDRSKAGFLIPQSLSPAGGTAQGARLRSVTPPTPGRSGVPPTFGVPGGGIVTPPHTPRSATPPRGPQPMQNAPGYIHVPVSQGFQPESQ